MTTIKMTRRPVGQAIKLPKAWPEEAVAYKMFDEMILKRFDTYCKGWIVFTFPWKMSVQGMTKNEKEEQGTGKAVSTEQPSWSNCTSCLLHQSAVMDGRWSEANQGSLIFIS